MLKYILKLQLHVHKLQKIARTYVIHFHVQLTLLREHSL